MLEMAKSSGGARKKCDKPSPLDCSTPRFSMGNRSTSFSPIDTILGQMNQSLSRRVNQESPNGKVASSSHSQDGLGQKAESSGGSKMDVLRPFSNNLSANRSTVTFPLQFVSSAGSQSGTMENVEEQPLAVHVATANEISTPAATAEVRKRSGSDRHGSKRKHRSETPDDVQGSKRLFKKSSKIAKSEISALAMRELKLLKIDKTHGSDRFKEVARAATHTVLASCGLEHSPELALALPKPVCKHKPPKASEVPNTCKECLPDFVKQAIRLVLSGEQTEQAAGASC